MRSGFLSIRSRRVFPENGSKAKLFAATMLENVNDVFSISKNLPDLFLLG